MTDVELRETYRRRQISQWEFAPEGAFRVFEHVDTGLSQATCQFVFYERKTGALVKADCSEELKRELTAAAMWLHN